MEKLLSGLLTTQPEAQRSDVNVVHLRPLPVYALKQDDGDAVKIFTGGNGVNSDALKTLFGRSLTAACEVTDDGWIQGMSNIEVSTPTADDPNKSVRYSHLSEVQPPEPAAPAA